MKLSCTAATLCLAALAAQAHDSWFEARRDLSPGPGAAVLALGTGNQFPKHETGIAATYLAASGCDGAAGILPLKALRNDDISLLLRAPAGASSCWAQTRPFDITVAADKVPLYLNEIRASPEIRATWAAMQSRGLPWRERYAKHARIDMRDDPAVAMPRQPAKANKPLGMDLRLEPQGGNLAAGRTVTAVVLRDGQPLAGQALELRSEDSPLGIWRRSDEQGRVSLPLPLPGRWLLRGVDLRVSDTRPDEWESRFVTLAFTVGPHAQAGDPSAAQPTTQPATARTATASD